MFFFQDKLREGIPSIIYCNNRAKIVLKTRLQDQPFTYIAPRDFLLMYPRVNKLKIGTATSVDYERRLWTLYARIIWSDQFRYAVIFLLRISFNISRKNKFCDILVSTAARRQITNINFMHELSSQIREYASIEFKTSTNISYFTTYSISRDRTTIAVKKIRVKRRYKKRLFNCYHATIAL